MEKVLTIIITTYNRKAELLDVLQSIEKQGQYDKYSVIVSNNKSDYDVDSWLDANLTPAFRKIVEVYNRPYNVGGAVNIAFTFQLAKTKWMWLRSDDEITEPDSLLSIFNDIEKYPDICWFKYSISNDEFTAFKEIEINNLTDLFNYFSIRPHYFGELNLQSNNVFNLHKLHNYIGYAPMYSHTCISQLFPALFAIKQEGIPMLLRSKAVVGHGGGKITYNLLYAYLSIGNVLYSKLYLNKAEIKAFKHMVSKSYDNFRHLAALMKIEERALRFQCFKKLWIENYRWFSFKGQAFAMSFLLMHTCNIKTEDIKKMCKRLSIKY